MERILWFALLLAGELTYLAIAKHFNINDRPNLRSSHHRVVIRGGGIVFMLGVWLFALVQHFEYPYFVIGMTIISIVSFTDDVMHVSARFRFIIQFASMLLMMCEAGLFGALPIWVLLAILLLGVCMFNAYNFMDGINGMTALNSLIFLIILYLFDKRLQYVDPTLIEMCILSVAVFAIFNFRNKAICFAGDVGSIGMSFCIVFFLLKFILQQGDPTYLMFLAIYGVDPLLTLCHRIYLHENLLTPHRRHLFQLLANEGGYSHLQVSTAYAILQLLITAGLIFLPVNRYLYSFIVIAVLVTAYVLIARKLYPIYKAGYLRRKAQDEMEALKEQ